MHVMYVWCVMCVYMYVFLRQGLTLYSSIWPRTHSVSHTDLELTANLLSEHSVLGLQAGMLSLNKTSKFPFVFNKTKKKTHIKDTLPHQGKRDIIPQGATVKRVWNKQPC